MNNEQGIMNDEQMNDEMLIPFTSKFIIPYSLFDIQNVLQRMNRF